MLSQDVIKLADVRPGDIIESAHVRYEVKSITPDSSPARGGYNLRLVRLSDGYETINHSLYIGKEVILISRKPVLTPAAPRRYFDVDGLTAATPTAIRMTWESIKSFMGHNRRVIESSFMATCECCGGAILVGESCLWVKGHVIHLMNQRCVDEQAAMVVIVTNRQARQAAHEVTRVIEKARHAARVLYGTVTMFPALLPGPMSLDGCELWASGD